MVVMESIDSQKHTDETCLIHCELRTQRPAMQVGRPAKVLVLARGLWCLMMFVILFARNLRWSAPMMFGYVSYRNIDLTWLDHCSLSSTRSLDRSESLWIVLCASLYFAPGELWHLHGLAAAKPRRHSNLQMQLNHMVIICQSYYVNLDVHNSFSKFHERISLSTEPSIWKTLSRIRSQTIL